MRGLVSVFDKAGVAEFARGLHEAGFEILSTGGTAKALKDAGIPVTEVSGFTGSPELFGGRIKTLHPKVHAGVLAPSGAKDVELIDLVCVNLYPFEAKPGIENIDVGGVALLRAAAKNFERVTVVSSPDQYEAVLKEIKENKAVSLETRKSLATKAFELTARYDRLIRDWFGAQEMRYGENPHQKAWFYGSLPTQLHGKELSYNNACDASAALELIREFSAKEGAACAIIKHSNPCGVALGTTLAEAFKKAFEADKLSPFGGVIAFNKKLDKQAAQEMDELFYEVVLAPGFEKEALETIKSKQNRRVLDVTDFMKPRKALQRRSVFDAGELTQEQDSLLYKELKCVTKRKPTPEEEKDLLFAWRVAKHAKSNAIVFARDGQALGTGAGQTSRVGACELAIARAKKAGLDLSESVLASDAFFPFPDCVELAASVGTKAIIQPGGSVKDKESIAACDEHGVAMLFTGTRHFEH